MTETPLAKWIIKNESANIKLMSETLSISEITARALVNRQIRSKNAALRFLYPEMTFLRDASVMKDMPKAIEIAADSVIKGERIFIFGDYDADGVMSCSILYKALRELGAEAYYYIPDRMKEGYGFTMTSVERLRAFGAKLVITCDNGIASAAEADAMRDLGVRLVIIDHHEPPFVADETGRRVQIIPKADAVVNPKRFDCVYPFKELCAAGISYKFAELLYRRFDKPFLKGKEMLTLAMTATFCDVVDLTDENRVIAKQGLDVLNADNAVNAGLLALIKEKGLFGKIIGSYAVGFIIGPCVNATGRLGHAAMAADMITAENDEEAETLAARLSELNETRKAMTARAVETAADIIYENDMENDKVLVVFDKEAHESVAGIVAGRLRERFCRPAIVVTRSESGALKGSGRSVEGYNMFEALYESRDALERFGGHAMAAGLSIREENLDKLRRCLNALCALDASDFRRFINIDDKLKLSDVTFALANELKRLEPWGKGNPEPLFLTEDARPRSVRLIDAKDMVILTFEADKGRYIKGLCFGQAGVFRERISAAFEPYQARKIMNGVLRGLNFSLDIVYAVDINEYNNDISVQLKIKDFAVRRASNI
ncbi:MAG: single-stranded-DNA-specific exonuclease RecJ [Clostridiales bacterium]|jgi:single-stranded-DNA-specific exonuclease|nr:single-stranded-DNA-specific exonuclease RecJ [Clostridiales bacterium]